jgi:hypothetical protein
MMTDKAGNLLSSRACVRVGDMKSFDHNPFNDG